MSQVMWLFVLGINSIAAMQQHNSPLMRSDGSNWQALDKTGAIKASLTVQKATITCSDDDASLWLQWGASNQRCDGSAEAPVCTAEEDSDNTDNKKVDCRSDCQEFADGAGKSYYEFDEGSGCCNVCDATFTPTTGEDHPWTIYSKDPLKCDTYAADKCPSKTLVPSADTIACAKNTGGICVPDPENEAVCCVAQGQGSNAKCATLYTKVVNDDFDICFTSTTGKVPTTNPNAECAGPICYAAVDRAIANYEAEKLRFDTNFPNQDDPTLIKAERDVVLCCEDSFTQQEEDIAKR